MSTITTPYMDLALPVVGGEPGPNWASDLNTALTTLDSHNHTSGMGVQVPTAGLNINADLDFNNFRVLNTSGVALEPQSTTPTINQQGEIYAVTNGNYADLYYNNGVTQTLLVQAGVPLPPNNGFYGTYATSGAAAYYGQNGNEYAFTTNVSYSVASLAPVRAGGFYAQNATSTVALQASVGNSTTPQHSGWQISVANNNYALNFDYAANATYSYQALTTGQWSTTPHSTGFRFGPGSITSETASPTNAAFSSWNAIGDSTVAGRKVVGEFIASLNAGYTLSSNPGFGPTVYLSGQPPGGAAGSNVHMLAINATFNDAAGSYSNFSIFPTGAATNVLAFTNTGTLTSQLLAVGANLVPSSDVTLGLGTQTVRWAEGFFSNGIVTGALGGTSAQYNVGGIVLGTNSAYTIGSLGAPVNTVYATTSNYAHLTGTTAAGAAVSTPPDMLPWSGGTIQGVAGGGDTKINNYGVQFSMAASPLAGVRLTFASAMSSSRPLVLMTVQGASSADPGSGNRFGWFYVNSTTIDLYWTGNQSINFVVMGV